MPVRKFAISFAPDLYDAIAQDVEDEGISSWLADAARAKLRYKAAQEALRAYEAEHGEITTAEIEAVEEAWFKE